MELFWTNRSPKQLRIERALVDAARRHLRDENVLAVFRGQTFLSPAIAPLIGSLTVVAKPRTVIVTANSVVTVQQSLWSLSRVTSLVSQHRCGSVPIELSRWGLKIGDDAKIFAFVTTFEDMKQVAHLADRRSG